MRTNPYSNSKNKKEKKNSRNPPQTGRLIQIPCTNAPPSGPFEKPSKFPLPLNFSSPKGRLLYGICSVQYVITRGWAPYIPISWETEESEVGNAARSTYADSAWVRTLFFTFRNRNSGRGALAPRALSPGWMDHGCRFLFGWAAEFYFPAMLLYCF